MTDETKTSLEDIFKKYPALEKEIKDHERGIKLAHDSIGQLEIKVQDIQKMQKQIIEAINQLQKLATGRNR